MRIAGQLFTTASLLAASAGTWAHDGHGLGGSHWHASDAYGFALVAMLAAIAIWLSRD